MFIKNLKEDRVYKAIRDILSDLPEVCRCPICIEDIAAYVLNRTNPYYISSGRGILHLEKDIEPYLQDQADIYALILQGSKIIMDRRKGRKHNLSQNGLDLLDIGEMEISETYILNFPYIIGRVLDYISLKPKIGVKVELFVFKDGKYKLAEMHDAGWQNPYVIPIEFEGHFTFWPKSIAASSQQEHIKENVNFKLIVEDGEYEEEFSIEVMSDKLIHHKINTSHVYQLTPILI